MRNFTAEQQRDLIEAVIRQVETRTPFRIVRTSADNLATNVRMYRLMNVGSATGELHHAVRHPVQEYADTDLVPFIYRILFVDFDYCHILKNGRSQFLFRELKMNGHVISPAYVRRVKEQEEQNLAKAARKLRNAVVNPVGVEKQKVNPAMELFRPETTAAIRLYMSLGRPGFEDAEPTVLFMEKMHKWIAIHDISSTTEHWKKRLPDKKPFSSPDDERFEWLEQFIVEMNAWQEEVEQLVQSIPVADKKGRKAAKRTGLTKETHQAFIHKTRCTIDFIRYLLGEDFLYFLTRNLSSDEIERLFGGIRQMCGVDFKVNPVAAACAFEKILRTGIACASINGNVRLERESAKTYALIRANDPGRKRAASALSSLEPSQLSILDELKSVGWRMLFYLTFMYCGPHDQFLKFINLQEGLTMIQRRRQLHSWAVTCSWSFQNKNPAKIAWPICKVNGRTRSCTA